MALVVNTNIASMNAQRALAANTSDMKQAMERLSTGKKINSAADDAAGFAIAETMTSQIRGLSMAAKNASDALGLLKVVENATNDVTDMLQRVRELAVQAKSNTNGDSDVQRLQNEAEALFREVTRVSDQTQYNGTAYLGDAATSVTGKDIKIQVGYKDRETIDLKTHNIAAVNLGGLYGSLENAQGVAQAATQLLYVNEPTNITSSEIEISDGIHHIHVTVDTGTGATHSTLVNDIQNTAGYDSLNFEVSWDDPSGSMLLTWDGDGSLATAGGGAYFDYTTATSTWTRTATNHTSYSSGERDFLKINSENALQTITDAIAQVAGFKAAWGADQNRLEYTISNLMNVVEFTSAARSRIQDADFAVEAANLAKAQVLQQTGAAMLAQANAAPQLALQLLK